MTRSAYAGGQALTEFLVLAFALIPLFLLVPIIAKYQDIAHSTQMASRYAAFNAGVRNHTSSWTPEQQLAGEIRRRFFSNTDAPIKTNDVAGNFLAHRNLFWRGPRGEPLITDLDSDVVPSFGRHAGTTHDQGFIAANDRDIYTLADSIGLQTRGIYRANVSVRIANLPHGIRSIEPFNAIDLALTRTSSVLIDPWMASGPQHTDDRVYPASVLAAHRATGAAADAEVTPIDLLGGVRGPRLGQLDFWQDLVPADRLR
jgi:hypothetical protein